MNYRIADLDEQGYKAVQDAEHLLKKETGKDYVVIAWEKEK